MSTSTARRPSARERLLDAADELFYEEGIHTVGIDRVIDRAGVAKASLYSTFGSKEELVRAYLEAIRRGTKGVTYKPRALTLWTVKDALSRLRDLVGSLPDWSNLELFLPANLADPIERRAAISSTLLASLEMARGGAVRLLQQEAFGPILVRRHNADAELAR